MGFSRKLIVNILIVAVLCGLFGNTYVKAGSKKDIPTISVKTINKKTGVKITVGKLGKEGEYRIYITGCGNAYKNYKYTGERLLEKGETDGKSKITYTINGLPEGKYKFRVAFREKVKVTYEDCGVEITDYYMADAVYSKLKSVKIVKGGDKRNEKLSYDFSKVKQGDMIKFGAYEQDDDMLNGKEAIEWIVISKSKKEITLLCKEVIDCVPYSKEYDFVKWEDCTLRKWLDKEFYSSAFDETEKIMIKVRDDEKVSLLSYEELIGSECESIFESCQATKYAEAIGCSVSDSSNHGCSWWLKNDQSDCKGASGVSSYGEYGYDYQYVNNSLIIGVRPTIILKIK